MAQVDFSNAILTPINYNGYLPINYSYFGLRNPFFYTTSGSRVNTNEHCNILSETYNKNVISYTGVFNTSGTEFLIGDAYAYYRMWKVSNISFQNGDSYSFIIELEAKGNT